MTSHTVRLYVAAVSLLAFFVLWAALAAHPWRSAREDPRLTALALREQALRREAALARRIVEARSRTAAGSGTRAVRAAAPQPTVRIVRLPPLVVTRSS